MKKKERPPDPVFIFVMVTLSALHYVADAVKFMRPVLAGLAIALFVICWQTHFDQTSLFWEDVTAMIGLVAIPWIAIVRFRRWWRERSKPTNGCQESCPGN